MSPVPGGREYGAGDRGLAIRLRALAVIRTMIHASGLYEACKELFAKYLPAVRDDGGDENSHSMVLMAPERAVFFVLWLEYGEDGPRYSLGPWPAGEGTEISFGDDNDLPREAADVLTHGVPIPRDGSLFGWIGGNTVTALIVIYAEYTPDCPEPSWTIMPLAGTPESHWPPFTDERLLGHWFWEHFQAGNIISLDELVAGFPGTVFWVDAKAVFGSACCVVARDISSSEGPTLRRGRYAFFQELRTGKPVPGVEALLVDAAKVDLAPRFEFSGRAEH